ncbi:MAG: ADP-ribosylation factor-like protein [Candidatus Heimdallarchaeota archaeon]
MLSSFGEKVMQKILFIGIDGAGKTALYQKFFGKKPPAQLLNIPPTRGIAKYKHDFLRSDVEIVDVGGGKKFRQGYIGNKELVANLSAIVYFVDVQNAAKYEEAANFLILWTKSVADQLKNVKGYILFNKIDPGLEAQIKNGLAHLAQLIAPLDGLIQGGLIKSITSIYTDSSNQTLQRILLDTLPKKMSIKPVTLPPVQQEPATHTPPVQKVTLTPPVEKQEDFITKPVTSKTVAPPKLSTPPVAPPKLVESPITDVAPPDMDIAQPMKEEEAKRIQEKVAERLSDIITATLDNNTELTAIAVYTENAERVVGAVQRGANPEILQLIEITLSKINLEEYMQKIGKIRIGGEGHLKIDVYNIFFEKVSPEHVSTVICTSIEDSSIKNIQQLNRYLNQALSVNPEGVSDDTLKRSDLMTELKMRLHRRGKSVDELL